MMDLEHGIIDVNGFEISKDTTAQDIKKFDCNKVDIDITKRERTIVDFKEGIVSNGVKMYLHMAYSKEGKIFRTELWPELPDDIKDDGHGKLAKEALRLSKQWLKGIILSSPDTDNDIRIYYDFKDVDYYASIHNDRDYGLVGGEISIYYK